MRKWMIVPALFVLAIVGYAAYLTAIDDAAFKCGFKMYWGFDRNCLERLPKSARARHAD